MAEAGVRRPDRLRLAALAAFRVHPESQTAARSRSLDDFRRQMEMLAEQHLGQWPDSHRLLRDSRIWERVCARVRARLAPSG